MSNFAGSLGFNGYQKLPTGLIIQWGALNVNGTSGAVGTTDVSFPIAFPIPWQRSLRQSQRCLANFPRR
ncbi:gp53-like domain-containing protein [Enterobacter hormaechei]|uniref:gp53-like domain-containing protein n=1 Tax=Enterobacter hormaechei TaxID=158836 RepID=UPI003D36D6F3